MNSMKRLKAQFERLCTSNKGNCKDCQQLMKRSNTRHWSKRGTQKAHLSRGLHSILRN
jgi:hypothetical protein